MARTTAQLEGWIVRGSTTAGVPAGGEPEANGPNGRRATETGDRGNGRGRGRRRKACLCGSWRQAPRIASQLAALGRLGVQLLLLPVSTTPLTKIRKFTPTESPVAARTLGGRSHSTRRQPAPSQVHSGS